MRKTNPRRAYIHCSNCEHLIEKRTNQIKWGNDYFCPICNHKMDVFTEKEFIERIREFAMRSLTECFLNNGIKERTKRWK